MITDTILIHHHEKMYVVLLMKIMYKCNVENSFLQAFSNETMLAQTIAQIKVKATGHNITGDTEMDNTTVL